MNTPDNVSNNPRPKLSDPEEFAIVKKVYFTNRTFRAKDFEDLDPIEKMERFNKRLKNKVQQSR